MSGERGYANGPFGQIHFRDTGAGTDTGTDTGAPLLLFHQAPMSHRQFDTVCPLLHERGVRAIAVDLPGFGMSDPPSFLPTIRDYAKIAAPLLDHLGIEEAFLLGHHTGAAVATEAAQLLGSRALGLILNGPTPFDEATRKSGLEYVEAKEKGFAPELDGSHLANAFVNRTSFANEDTQWPLTTRYVCEQFTGLGPFWYGHHAAFVYDHAAAIKMIAHPTLILTNTGDQIYDLALLTHQLRPDFAFTKIAGGGIDIVDEKPAEWCSAVADFISKTRLTD